MTVKPEKLLNNLFKKLHQYKVRYIVVGGMALNYHGIIRATKDIDLFLEASRDNMVNFLQAMEAAGFETALEANPASLLSVDITVFKDIIRIDLLTKVTGLEFESAWKNRNTIRVKKNPIFVASLDDLIASKEETGRTIDAQDLEKLRILRSMREV
jgi:hypothetical protein